MAAVALFACGESLGPLCTHVDGRHPTCNAPYRLPLLHLERARYIKSFEQTGSTLMHGRTGEHLESTRLSWLCSLVVNHLVPCARMWMGDIQRASFHTGSPLLHLGRARGVAS